MSYKFSSFCRYIRKIDTSTASAADADKTARAGNTGFCCSTKGGRVYFNPKMATIMMAMMVVLTTMTTTIMMMVQNDGDDNDAR